MLNVSISKSNLFDIKTKMRRLQQMKQQMTQLHVENVILRQQMTQLQIDNIILRQKRKNKRFRKNKLER